MNANKTHNVELKDRLNEVVKNIRVGRKTMKEESTNNQDLYNRWAKREITTQEWIAWSRIVTNTKDKSFEARCLNMILAFRNGTPFSKVEVYGFDEKWNPFRLDGKDKPIKRNREDMLMRCLEQRKAIDTACSMVAVEEREAFTAWTRVGEVGTNP